MSIRMATTAPSMVPGVVSHDAFSCATAFGGDTAVRLFDDDEILADALTLYFTDHEPSSCFVAERSGKVIGYIIGSKDVSSMNWTLRLKIIPLLLLKAFLKGVFFRKKDIRFFLHCASSFFKGEFSAPDFTKEYPATLHINLDKDARGLGLGTRLIENYMGFLREAGVKGVALGTASERAKQFFERSGFGLLFDKTRSFMRYQTGHDVQYYIMGRKL